MREIRPSGSEGGGILWSSLPLSIIRPLRGGKTDLK
jgi:hypothetical protein